MGEAIDHSKEYKDETARLLDEFNKKVSSDIENFSNVSEEELYNSLSEQEVSSVEGFDSNSQWPENYRTPYAEEDSDVSPYAEEGPSGENAAEGEAGLEANPEVLESYQLAKDEAVWDKLEEYYDGEPNQQNKVGNAVLKFRNGVKDNLLGQGVFDNEAQAEQFLNWRFRHMDVGSEVNMTKEGLNIPGFANDENISRFKEEELGVAGEAGSGAEAETGGAEQSAGEEEAAEAGAIDKEALEKEIAQIPEEQRDKARAFIQDIPEMEESNQSGPQLRLAIDDQFFKFAGEVLDKDRIGINDQLKAAEILDKMIMDYADEHYSGIEGMNQAEYSQLLENNNANMKHMADKARTILNSY